MASDFDAKQAVNLFRAVMVRHGAAKNAKNAIGVTQSVTIAVLFDSADLERVATGRDSIRRTKIGVLTANDVTETWQFDVLGNDEFWAVDSDGQGIVRYAGGMFLVPVIRSEIHDRGDPEYHAKD